MQPAPEKFGSRKVVVFKPDIRYDGTKIPVLAENGTIYRILGKFPACDLDNKESVQQNTENHIRNCLNMIDKSPISDYLKIKTYRMAFRSLTAWTLGVSDIDPGWVERHLDPIGRQYIKKRAYMAKRGANDHFIQQNDRIEKCISWLSIRSSKNPIIFEEKR